MTKHCSIMSIMLMERVCAADFGSLPFTSSSFSASFTFFTPLLSYIFHSHTLCFVFLFSFSPFFVLQKQKTADFYQRFPDELNLAHIMKRSQRLNANHAINLANRIKSKSPSRREYFLCSLKSISKSSRY